MSDECTDASNKEQLVICIHGISNSDLEVHEDVIGLYVIVLELLCLSLRMPWSR